MIRLDKFLSNMGLGSRKEVNEWIKKGLVSVDGQPVLLPKTKISEEADVVFAQEKIAYQDYLYFLLNKPAGVLSASRDARATVLDCLREEDRRRGLFPVGRLDRDTTGLLLISDDGRLAHQLLSPKNKIPKTYEALVDKPLDPAIAQVFRQGIPLKEEGIRTQPATFELISDTLAHLTITEGKYHQVKRMFSYCGYQVLALKRLRMGPLELGEDLLPGDYRPLRPEEVQALKELGASGGIRKRKL